MAMEPEALRTKTEVLKAVADKEEQRVLHYQNRASVLIVSYLMWQRFFFLAVSRTSSPLESVNWWRVSGLSLSCSLVFLLNILKVFIMLCRTHKRLGMLCEEHAHICRRILKARKQDAEAGAPTDEVRALHNDAFSGGEIKVYVCAIAIALLAVTAFELYASNYLLLCP